MSFEYETNYMLVPLATFAVDNGTACEIYVKAQEDEISTAIFGTMFFQQFVAYYENGGNPQSAQRQNLTLALSPTAAMRRAILVSLPQPKPLTCLLTLALQSPSL